MRTDAAVCPRGGGRPRGSAPGNPGRGAASTLRKARAALAGASRPLTRRRVFSGGLPPKKTLGGIVKDGGYSRWRKGRSFSTLHRNGLPSRSLPTSRKSWEGGRWGSGGGGRKPFFRRTSLLPGTSHLPYQAVQRWRHSGMILPCSLRSVRNLSDSSGLVKVKSER